MVIGWHNPFNISETRHYITGNNCKQNFVEKLNQPWSSLEGVELSEHYNVQIS